MKIIIKKISLVTVLIGSVLTLGCSEPSNEVAKVGEKVVTAQELANYFEFKRLDAKNTALVESAKKQYLNNLALVQAIESQTEYSDEKLAFELFEIKKDLLLNRYFNQYLEQVVTETDMRNYYAQNQEQYQSQQAKVSHILLRVNPADDETTRQAKYSKAVEAYSKINTGSDFSVVAQSLSEDRVSAKKGGQLGWIKAGAIGATFSDTVFNQLKAGQVSEPILTDFGYHVILLEQEPKTVKRSFESVQGNIKRSLRKAAKDAELARLQSTVSITL